MPIGADRGARAHLWMAYKFQAHMTRKVYCVTPDKVPPKPILPNRQNDIDRTAFDQINTDSSFGTWQWLGVVPGECLTVDAPGDALRRQDGTVRFAQELALERRYASDVLDPPAGAKAITK